MLDKSGVKIAKEYDTPDWSPDKAQREMEQAITALGKDVVGVYSANDGMAGGAIAAMKGAGIDPATCPITRRRRRGGRHPADPPGEQYATIYLAISSRPRRSAELAVAMARGRDGRRRGLVNAKVDNGKEEVPRCCSTPVAVTKDNIADTVIKDELLQAVRDLHGQVRRRRAQRRGSTDAC